MSYDNVIDIIITWKKFCLSATFCKRHKYRKEKGLGHYTQQKITLFILSPLNNLSEMFEPRSHLISSSREYDRPGELSPE